VRLLKSPFNYPRDNQVLNSELSKKHSNKKSKWLILYAFWVVLIILSQVPFIAENLIDTSEMDASYDSTLTFINDGKTGHYYIERYDTDQNGLINVIYTTDSNSLEVECYNIKILKIYCRELYEDESEDVFKRDPELDSNYYKTYFIGRDHFHVHVNTKRMITELEFIDAPIPYNVTVNGQEWWLSGINYTYSNDSIVLTKVPMGHNYVDIYFKSNDMNSPVARFTASNTIIGVGETITFDASSSYDPDGSIISYVWDLGEGSYKIGVTTEHTYTDEGNYKVILTVKDNDYLIHRAYKDVTVIRRVMSISMSIDKPIATPGTFLTYKINLQINSTWQNGVKDIVITDILPDELAYISANPLPALNGNTITWRLGSAIYTQELPAISLRTVIDKDIENESIISNYAMLDYKGMDNQDFPQELTGIVNTKVNVDSLLAPKIIGTVPDVKLYEDAPPFNLYLSPYEFDFLDSGTNLNWYITGENKSLYILSGEKSAEDILTITPIPNAFGNNLVTLWLVDSENYTTNQPLWINITPVNDNPVFSKAPNLIIHYDDPYAFDYQPYINDIDTPQVELKLFVSENIDGIGDSNGETSPHIKIDGLKVTYTYPESYVGIPIFVTLIAFDGQDNDAETIQINVTDDYTPKLVIDIPDILLNEGESKFDVFDLDDYFEDPDGDSLYYSLGETYVNVSIDENNSVDVSSPTDWFGSNNVTFRAQDPVGALAEDTILIKVIPINDPPIIDDIPDYFIVHYDVDYIFDLTPYVSDKDNELEELFIVSPGENIRTDPLKPLKIILNYPQKLVGMEIPVALMVSDGSATANVNFIVKVTDSWPPEIDKELPDISFYEDDMIMNAFNLDNFFSDKDSDTLYFSYGQKNVNVTINSNCSVDFSAISHWYGVEIVTFRATDPSNAFVESLISVTVIPVNDPPVINPLPHQKGSVRNLFKFDLTDFIEDIDNDINELELSVESKELEIIINGMELVIYSEKPILEVITITVSDGEGEASETLLIEIGEVEAKPSIGTGYLWSLLLLLILIIILIIAISSYATYRKYVGDYTTEEVFWIHNTGILILHESSIKPKQKSKKSKKSKKTKGRADDDIVSGMLTAILDFTQEAFSDEEEDGKQDWGIKEIQMKGRNILVERGKHTFLATIFNGRSGKKLYKDSRVVLKSLEFKFNRPLKNWKGDIKKYKDGKKIIKMILPVSNIDESKDSNLKKIGKSKK